MNSEDKLRGTGRSLRLAIRQVETAMRNVGRPVQVRDHQNKIEAHLSQMNLCQDIVLKLELEGFTFYRDSLTMTCNYRPGKKEE